MHVPSMNKSKTLDDSASWLAGLIKNVVSINFGDLTKSGPFESI